MSADQPVTQQSNTPAVYAAIASVMREVGAEGISKDRKNTQQGYSFRGIDDVYNELNAILARNMLVIVPRVTHRERTEGATKQGGVLFYTHLDVEYDIISATDGSKHTACVVGEAMDSADKSSNKAMSAAYKYLCMQLFCIPTEGDNDTDRTTHEPAPRDTRRYDDRPLGTSAPRSAAYGEDERRENRQQREAAAYDARKAPAPAGPVNRDTPTDYSMFPNAWDRFGGKYANTPIFSCEEPDVIKAFVDGCERNKNKMAASDDRGRSRMTGYLAHALKVLEEKWGETYEPVASKT